MNSSIKLVSALKVHLSFRLEPIGFVDWSWTLSVKFWLGLDIESELELDLKSESESESKSMWRYK